jgi:hypothetical protein
LLATAPAGLRAIAALAAVAAFRRRREQSALEMGDEPTLAA